MAGLISRGLPSAGIFAGPVAWMIDTQANYALVPWVCATQIRAVPMVAVAMLVVSFAGAFLSWRGYASRGGMRNPDDALGGRPHRVVALVGIGTALLFALVIVVQGAAGLVFHGCER